MNSEGYNIPKGTKKIRTGNYVIYDIDYLLDNLAREVCLLETVRRDNKIVVAQKEFEKDGGRGCLKCPSHNKCDDAFQLHSRLCNHYDKTDEEFAEWLKENKDWLKTQQR